MFVISQSDEEIKRVCFFFFPMDSISQTALKHLLVWSNPRGFKNLASVVSPIDHSLNYQEENLKALTVNLSLSHTQTHK